jgi:hypothetical protein
MKNTLYNVDQIVKISKHNGGGKTHYKYSPPTYITLFGKKFEISGEGYYYGAFSIDSKSIIENEYIFKGDDGKYYWNPSIRIYFTDSSYKEIPFKTIKEMVENFNWWKNNYPNLIEL